jgi:phage terminase large subunit-like protein
MRFPRGKHDDQVDSTSQALAELMRFPRGKHDDQVDSTSQALAFIALQACMGEQAWLQIAREYMEERGLAWS